MLSLDATQLAIVAAENKDEISWLFQIDRTGNDVINDYWSTKAKTWDGHDYIYKVVDFSDIEMNRAQSESGIQAPSEFTFTIHNKDNTLTTADFSSARINLLFVVKAGANEAVIRSWSFRITEIDPGYQKLTFHCIDWLQAFLEGDYPKDAVVESLFIKQAQIVDISQLAGSVAPPGSGTPGSYEEIYAVSRLCAPLVFGRPTIPIIPIYFPSPEYFGYLLGRSTGTPSDYDVYTIKTPSDYTGNPLAFSKADYTFSYTDKVGQDGNNYTFGLFECLDSDGDGLPDISMAIAKGNAHMPLNAEYERADLKNKTAPADVLEYILEDWGIPSARIDTTSQAAANAIYAGWGLTWNVGLFNKESRKRLLARLCQMCHTELIARDEIYFKVHSKISQMTLTKAHIVKENDKGEGTFTYELIEKRDEKDAGYVTYQVAGECLDHLVKALVTVKGTYDNIASDVVSADYVQDSQAAQKIGMLAFQRKFLPLAKVTATLKATCLALECDDIVTPSHADYGGTYPVLIDKMTIHKDGSIDIITTRFSQALDDWGDLAPSSLTVVDDEETNHLEVVTTGPDAKDSAGNYIGNVLKGRLRIGETGNHILFDPVEPLQTFVEGGVTRMRIGDLGTDDWGIEFLDHAGTSIFKLDGSGVNTLSGWAVDGSKFTCQSGQVGMNAEVTGGVDWRFWAGHATPGSAPFRVDESGNLYCTLIYATGGTIGGWTIGASSLYTGAGATRIQLQPGTGIWAGATAIADAPFSVTNAGVLKAVSGTIGGWTIGATKLSITGIELDQANNRIRAYTGDNYVDMTAAGLTGYDSVLGTTFNLPTNGDAPEFSSGIIKECVYEIYTSGVIRTNADVANNGGLIINNTDLKGYTSAGLKVLQFIYDGTDQGDAYIGDFDNQNAGLKYDQSIGSLKIKALVEIIGNPALQNMLMNGGFEEMDGTNAYYWAGGAGISTEVAGGDNSNNWLEVTKNNGDVYVANTNPDGSNHYFEVNEGETYEFGGSCKSDGTCAFYIGIGVYDKDKANPVWTSVSGTDAAWTDKSATYTILAAGKFMRLYVAARTANGVVGFDNVYLKRVDEKAWSFTHASDRTKIDGGTIYTNTIVASAIKGTDFGTLTITSGKIAINTTDALEIAAAGNINVLAGGDIVMTPSDTNPALIKWSTIHNMGAATTAAKGLCIWPTTADQDYFAIGYSPVAAAIQRYRSISINFQNDITLLGQIDANNFVSVYSNVVTNTFGISIADAGNTGAYSFHYDEFYPEQNNQMELGLMGNRWKHGWMIDLTVTNCITEGTCEIIPGDALAIISDIVKPGSQIFNEFGHERFDMARLQPKYPWLFVNDGEEYLEKVGTKSDLLYQAVMQLDKRVKKIESLKSH